MTVSCAQLGKHYHLLSFQLFRSTSIYLQIYYLQYYKLVIKPLNKTNYHHLPYQQHLYHPQRTRRQKPHFRKNLHYQRNLLFWQNLCQQNLLYRPYLHYRRNLPYWQNLRSLQDLHFQQPHLRQTHRRTPRSRQNIHSQKNHLNCNHQKYKRYQWMNLQNSVSLFIINSHCSQYGMMDLECTLLWTSINRI
jgi:hypothetical protein